MLFFFLLGRGLNLDKIVKQVMCCNVVKIFIFKLFST